MLNRILSVAADYEDYQVFQMVISLGLKVDATSLSSDKILMFSWIKEALGNGRKN